MRWLWTALLSAGACFVLASACSDDDADPGAGGGTTTTPAGSTGGAGGAESCHVDLMSLLGTTQECHDCLNQSCCAQAAAYEADPRRGTFIALMMCSTDLVTSCSDQCNEEMCSMNGRELPILHDCNSCMTANCCNHFRACGGDSSCNSCIAWVSYTPAKCCGQPLFQQIDECLDTACAAECNQPIWPDCSGGGWGGMGGGGSSAGGGGASAGGGGSSMGGGGGSTGGGGSSMGGGGSSTGGGGGS